MSKFLVVVIGSFFVLGLGLGWVLGYHSAKYERPRGLDEEHEEGGGV